MADARQALLGALEAYSGIDDPDAQQARRIADLVRSEPRCAERTCYPAHLTGSAWLANRGRDKALLMHHTKLGIWLQPGGHADGDFRLAEVALREAREESGLSSAALWVPDVFDVDIHRIPARASEPEHYHYDVRFLAVADDADALVPNRESRALAWVPLDQLERYTNEWSVLRMREKLRLWRC